MISFREFHDKNILGVREQIHLLDHPELGEIPVKVDTGNEAYNVLHGVEVKDKGEHVTFRTINNQELTLPKIDTVTIHIGSGVKEQRPVVRLNFNMNGREYKDVPFSIADRSENEEAVLLGEPFLKQTNSVVDVKK
jgi:hypothetical protein